MMHKPDTILAYDPQWISAFHEINEILLDVLLPYDVTIEHVGSTSVAGMWAKPIIDIDIVANDSAETQAIIQALRHASWDSLGECGIAGRVMLETRPDLPFHHLYLVIRGNQAHKDHIDLRNYLRLHPEAAAEYSEEKLRLAPLLRSDREAYTQMKEPILSRLLAASRSECHDVGFVAMLEEHGPMFEQMINEYRAANETDAYGGIFSAALKSYEAFYALLDRMRRGGYPEPHNVPMDPYFVVLSGRLVGEVYVRRRLTPQLEQYGGHIGYKIRPAWRERGLATRALRFGLEKTAELGISHALVTCKFDNVRSMRVIEKCGGVRIADSFPTGMPTMRRYLVPTTNGRYTSSTQTASADLMV